MNDFVIIKRIDGKDQSRLEVIIYASPEAVATLENSILFETQKKGIRYVGADNASQG